MQAVRLHRMTVTILTVFRTVTLFAVYLLNELAMYLFAAYGIHRQKAMSAEFITELLSQPDEGRIVKATAKHRLLPRVDDFYLVDAGMEDITSTRLSDGGVWYSYGRHVAKLKDGVVLVRRYHVDYVRAISRTTYQLTHKATVVVHYTVHTSALTTHTVCLCNVCA